AGIGQGICPRGCNRRDDRRRDSLHARQNRRVLAERMVVHGGVVIRRHQCIAWRDGVCGTGFVFIAGPAVLMTLSRSASSGVQVGLATGFGIAVGDLVHTTLVIVGLAAIVLASALLFDVIKYLGAAYLVYLGIKAFLARTPNPLLGRAARLSPGTAFRQAVVAEILNPKSALFFVA